jgi:GTP-binding protein Era
MISATKGDGLDALLDLLREADAGRAVLYPRIRLADIPSRLLAAEITREKALSQAA